MLMFSHKMRKSFLLDLLGFTIHAFFPVSLSEVSDHQSKEWWLRSIQIVNSKPIGYESIIFDHDDEVIDE